MSRFPSGFWFFVVLLLLALLPSLSSWGAEIVISETMWNGLKLEYAQLVTHNESLSLNLENSQSIVTDLRVELAKQWLTLNEAKNESAILSAKLRTAETQAVYLGSQLAESENGLTELKKSIRAAKVRAYLIGGCVGVVVGAVITGLLVGMVN